MTESQESSEVPQARAGRWWRRGCGCLAVGFGGLLVLVLSLPRLAGGWLARTLREDFDERHAGSLWLEAPSLSWGRRQRVEGLELRDPEGEVVIAGSLELPSMAELLAAARSVEGDAPVDLGRFEVRGRVDLVLDATGDSNLDAALHELPATEESPGPGASDEAPVEEPDLELFERLRLGLDVVAEELRLRDPAAGLDLRAHDVHLELGVSDGRVRADVDPFDLADPLAAGGVDALDLSGVAFTARVDPEGELRMELGTSLAENAEERSRASLVLERGWSKALLDDAPETLRGSLSAELRGLPVGRLRRRLGEEEDLEGLLGEALGLRLEVELARAEAGEFTLALESERCRLDAEGSLAGGRLVIGEGGLVAETRIERTHLVALLRDALPPDAVLTTPAEELSVELRVDALELPLEETGELPRLRARLDLGALDYTDGVLAPRALEVHLERSGLDLELGPEGFLSAALRGEGLPGAVQVTASNLEPWDPSPGAAPPPLAVELSLEGTPTVLLDAYADQGGLLTEVLGARVDARLALARLTDAGGPLELEATSPNGSLRWRGRLEVAEDGQARLVSDGSEELRASLAMTPLLGERVVGPLVPLLVDVQKPDEEPVRLSARDLSLPLDGDLRGLEGSLHLELGRVTSSFLPALARELPGLSSLAGQSTDVEPLELGIERGVVRYDRLPLEIDGRPLVFAGSYDLLTGALDLGTEVRLADLGGEVGALLSGARRSLGADFAVPLRIGGTPGRPRLSLREGFVEEALRDVGREKLEGELERGLRKLFGD